MHPLFSLIYYRKIRLFRKNSNLFCYMLTIKNDITYITDLLEKTVLYLKFCHIERYLLDESLCKNQ